jgi:hypothetical protein
VAGGVGAASAGKQARPQRPSRDGGASTAYRRVNLNLVWRAVERLPEIEAQIVAILAQDEWPE